MLEHGATEPGRTRDDLGATRISTGGHAGRGDVRPLAVTDVLTAMRSADETKPRPTYAARPYVAGEIVAQFVDLNVE
jgi:hypothetical protein